MFKTYITIETRMPKTENNTTPENKDKNALWKSWKKKNDQREREEAQKAEM